MAVKVFLVDDHEVVRRGLIDLLSADSELDVIGEAGSVAQALSQIPALQPDVADPRCTATRRQRNRAVPRPAVEDARPALPHADVVHLRRGHAQRNPRRSERIRRQGHQRHGTGQGDQDVGAGRSLLDNRAAAALMAKLRGAAERSDPFPVSPSRNASCSACSRKV